MIESNMRENKSLVKAALLIVLLLTVLPLVLFILIQFVPRQDNTPSAETANAETASGRSTAAERCAQRAETRVARQETKTTRTVSVPHDMPPDPGPADFDFNAPEDISVVGVGAVVPNAPRSKQATPYPPGTVPGDSGVMVQYAGSPDDMVSGPVPPPEEDFWVGAVLPPMTPEQMRGIGGVRRIDPNDPFFQQDIPNPFAN